MVGVVGLALEESLHAQETPDPHGPGTYFGTMLVSTSTGVSTTASVGSVIALDAPSPVRVAYAHPIEILHDSVSERIPVGSVTFVVA
jgi:hypothetical protein